MKLQLGKYGEVTYVFTHDKRWCNMVIVRVTQCTPDIPAILVSFCPFYVLQLLFMLVYTHPSANADCAAEYVASLDGFHYFLDETKSDLDDLKHDILDKTLKNCHQLCYAPRPKQQCYCVIALLPFTSRSLALPPISSADHSSVLRAPVGELVY